MVFLKPILHSTKTAWLVMVATAVLLVPASCTRHMDERERRSHIRAFDQGLMYLVRSIGNNPATDALWMFFEAGDAPLPFQSGSGAVFEMGRHSGVYEMHATEQVFRRVADSDSIVLKMEAPGEAQGQIRLIISNYREAPTLFGHPFPEEAIWTMLLNDRELMHAQLQATVYEGVPAKLELEARMEELELSLSINSRLRRHRPSRYTVEVLVRRRETDVFRGGLQTWIRLSEHQPVHEKAKAWFELFPIKGKIRVSPATEKAGPGHPAHRLAQQTRIRLAGVHGRTLGDAIPLLRASGNVPDLLVTRPGVDSLWVSEETLSYKVLKDIKLPHGLRSGSGP